MWMVMELVTTASEETVVSLSWPLRGTEWSKSILKKSNLGMDTPKLISNPPSSPSYIYGPNFVMELQTCSLHCLVPIYRRHEPTRDPSNQSAVAAATSR
jgi:hypothetical protein